jgi:hypothetical protein
VTAVVAKAPTLPQTTTAFPASSIATAFMLRLGISPNG